MTKGAIPENLLYFYNDPGCVFMSISDCPPGRLDAVLDGKNDGNAFFASRFSREKREQYLQHRAVIEERLFADFVAKGGTPKRRFPYYCPSRKLRPSYCFGTYVPRWKPASGTTDGPKT